MTKPNETIKPVTILDTVYILLLEIQWGLSEV